MKKILSALTLFAFAQCAYSQNLQPGVSSDSQTTLTAYHQINGNEQNESIKYVSEVNTKAVRDFRQTYKTVTNEKWYEMPDGIRATFTLNDIRYRLDYEKNGNWLHTIRYYDENKLPAETRRLVASSYLDHTVTFVEEIEKPRNVMTYIVHLEGKTNWINIKVSNGEIEEWQKFNKSN
jgi:hypothetical protein